MRETDIKGKQMNWRRVTMKDKSILKKTTLRFSTQNTLNILNSQTLSLIFRLPDYGATARIKELPGVLEGIQ